MQDNLQPSIWPFLEVRILIGKVIMFHSVQRTDIALTRIVQVVMIMNYK